MFLPQVVKSARVMKKSCRQANPLQKRNGGVQARAMPKSIAGNG
ncbi:MAG: hypothetical protein U0X39_04630 [Bacteroidales bacterium]